MHDPEGLRKHLDKIQRMLLTNLIREGIEFEEYSRRGGRNFKIPPQGYFIIKEVQSKRMMGSIFESVQYLLNSLRWIGEPFGGALFYLVDSEGLISEHQHMAGSPEYMNAFMTPEAAAVAYAVEQMEKAYIASIIKGKALLGSELQDYITEQP